MTRAATPFALLALLGMGLPATSLPAPAAAQSGREISCDSWNYQQARCPAPGARRVSLVRVSGGSCVEGQSWRFDGSAILVRNGCRGVFRLDDGGWGGGGWGDGGGWGGSGGSQTIRCESWNYRDATCPASDSIRNARLTRVIAGDCREGQTWRWDRRSIYVRNGCRADFEVQTGNGGGWGGSGGSGGGGGSQRIACNSWNFQPAR